AKAIAYDGKKWLAVPNTIVGLQIVNRASWWNEIGYGPEKDPANWEEWRDAGRKLKAKGHPLGRTVAHAFGDANAFWYPYLWSWGGKEVEADGKTVVLGSKETIESVKFAVAMWKDACDEGGLAWDDSGNNRAFLSGSISGTNNGASIYLEAKKKPDTYPTADGKPMKDDVFHTPLPKGPAGQFSWHVPFADMVMAYGKNQKPAKDFLRWFHGEKIYEQWWVTQQGFSVGPTKLWENHALWKEDPIMLPSRDAAESGHFSVYAVPANRKAAERISKDIISDTYSKAVHGMPAADKAAKAVTEMIPIVMAAIDEPLDVGVVASLAHPGGNVTGLSAFATELAGKRVELLKEARPSIARVGFLQNMGNPASPPQWEAVQAVAKALGLSAEPFDVRNTHDIANAFARLANEVIE